MDLNPGPIQLALIAAMGHPAKLALLGSQSDAVRDIAERRGARVQAATVAELGSSELKGAVDLVIVNDADAMATGAEALVKAAWNAVEDDGRFVAAVPKDLASTCRAALARTVAALSA